MQIVLVTGAGRAVASDEGQVTHRSLRVTFRSLSNSTVISVGTYPTAVAWVGVYPTYSDQDDTVTAFTNKTALDAPRRYAASGLALLQWAAVLTVSYALAELAEAVAVPAPQLLVAMLVGAALALTGIIKRDLPRQITGSSHALVGALMGTYLNVQTLRAVATTTLPLAAVTLATVGICFAVAFGLSRMTKINLPDSVLGMTPGGSAAIVACAGDVGADDRLVAFAQYIRVGLVAFTAPFIALAVQPSPPAETDDGAVVLGLPTPGHLIAATNQVSGLVVLTAICLLGSQLGRRFSLPAPVLLGSMLVAATAVATQAVSGFTPAGPLRDVIFVVVGLEVGLRFTWPVIRHVGRLLPYLIGSTLLVCAACAGLAWLLAEAIGMPFLEAYLATTPGGINAVLATADSTGVNVPVVSTVQSLRLFAVCLLVPFLIRKLNGHRLRSGPAKATVEPASAES
ncbi:AbrB family transcriptional regulator [Amycolatopsis acidiphila]|uniref:AbrB family transcriptional regulator n=1 Tax=Amycolatopsis acidiphila TaxID=715473 RepID=A0A558ADV7_9PSEU|nr:AbrB family transcriptional regulator [Amycolatopsis acidiphila]TVT22436.1 AbrB family transcriptional regulator [Amycolatopsis acidiphila]UIJ57640.1 AbrB family transcriptional regulator [Amycolatopsis acidiphila]GHG90013.1 AbrB family transcriptional regulator [Amycolatopsis acidiphila]